MNLGSAAAAPNQLKLDLLPLESHIALLALAACNIAAMRRAHHGRTIVTHAATTGRRPLSLCRFDRKQALIAYRRCHPALFRGPAAGGDEIAGQDAFRQTPTVTAGDGGTPRPARLLGRYLSSDDACQYQMATKSVTSHGRDRNGPTFSWGWTCPSPADS